MNFKITFVITIETIEKQFRDVLTIRRLNRCFLSNTQKRLKEVAALYAEAQLNLKLTATSVLNDSFNSNETTVFSLGSVRSVLPVAAIFAFDQVTDINNDISERKSYAALFHLLSYEFCIDAVFPLKVAPILLRCLESEMLQLPPSVANVVEMSNQMRFNNKEVADLLHRKNLRNSLPEEVLLLLQYCCELVIEIQKSDISED